MIDNDRISAKKGHVTPAVAHPLAFLACSQPTGQKTRRDSNLNLQSYLRGISYKISH